jgi:hypothetical protein
MKAYIFIIISLTFCYAQCESIILYRTVDESKFMLIRDTSRVPGKDEHMVFIADAIKLRADSGGTEMTLSNVVIYSTVVTKGKQSDKLVGQTRARAGVVTIGFPDDTILIFKSKSVRLSTVKNEDIAQHIK